MGGRDKKKDDKAARVQKRKESKEKQRQKEQQRQQEEQQHQSRAVSDLEQMFCEEDVPEQRASADSEWTPSTSRVHLRHPPQPLSIPRDILTQPLVLEAQTREGISPASAANFLAAIIASSKGNLHEYGLSANNIRKKKNEKMTEAAETARQQYEPPIAPILCWDEKKIERNGGVENRMPVAICGDERCLC